MNPDCEKRLRALENTVELLEIHDEIRKVAIASPPARFKVGDWVRNKTDDIAGRISQINQFNPYCLRYYVYRTDGRVVSCLDSDLTPWVPREGEWVIHKLTNELIFGPFQFNRERHIVPEGYIPAPLGSDSQEWFK